MLFALTFVSFFTVCMFLNWPAVYTPQLSTKEMNALDEDLRRALIDPVTLMDQLEPPPPTGRPWPDADLPSLQA